MKSALPWVASLLAAVLLFTPTYGIGLVFSPLTLIGSWVALSAPARASAAVRAGAAFNLLLVIAGLSLLMVVWWPTGQFYFAITWALLVGVMLLAYATLLQRRQARKDRSGGGTRAV